MDEQIHGFAYPFRIDAQTGGVGTASGTEKIRQNIRVALGTRLGERPMLRDYGTRLHALVHEPNDSIIGDLIKTQAQQALLRWEPRILLTGAQVQQQDGEVRLQLDYVHTDAPLADKMIVPLK